MFSRRGLCQWLMTASNAASGVNARMCVGSRTSSSSAVNASAVTGAEWCSRGVVRVKPGSVEPVNALIDRYDTFLLDCDGVIWKAGKLLPRAREALALLRSRGKQLIFVTNGSLKSKAEFGAVFDRLGIEVDAHNLVPSTLAVAQYMHTRHPAVRTALVSGSSGLREELEATGIRTLGDEFMNSVFPGPNIRSRKDFIDVAEAIASSHERIDAVVCGFDWNCSFSRLAFMSVCLQHNPQCLFFATSRDAFDELGSTSGMSIKLPAMILPLTVLESSTGRQATVLGKPSADLGHFLQKRFSFDSARTCIVGDRLDSDILLGHNCGIESILVLTGTTTTGDLEMLRSMRSNAETNADSSPDADVAAADSSPSITITPAMRPDFVIDNLGVLVDAGR